MAWCHDVLQFSLSLVYKNRVVSVNQNVPKNDLAAARFDLYSQILDDLVLQMDDALANWDADNPYLRMGLKD